MSNVDFRNVVPAAFAMPQPSTTSKAVLKKNLVEILPVEQTTFSYDGNNIIRFQIASPSDILVGPESYIRFDFEQTVANHDNIAAFDVGGANCLFRNIEVRALGTGSLIQRYTEFHRYNALQSLLKDTPDEILQGGASYCDSMTDYAYASPYELGTGIVPTGTAFAIAVNGVVTGSGSLFLEQIEVGDYVVISGEDADSAGGLAHFHAGTVTAISSNTAMTLSPEPHVAMDGTNPNIRVYKRSSLMPARVRASDGSGTARVITLRPRISAMMHNLPLFLIKNGIEISLELELPGRAMRLIPSSSSSSVDTTAMAYQITRPRFFAMMVTPHKDIADEYKSQWMSSEGLLYNIPGMRYRRTTGAASDQDVHINYNVGVRSARRAYFVIQDSALAEGSSTNEYANYAHSISNFLRDFVTSFQVKVGAHEFPQRPIICNADSFEMREQLKNVCGNYGACRLQPQDWVSETSEASGLSTKIPTASGTVAYDAKHFIFAVDLSRDNGRQSTLTGMDLSVAPLDVELVRSAAHNASSRFAGTPIYHLFVEHDAYLKISQENISVIQ